MFESQRAPRARAGLRAPIKDELDVALSEGDVQRMWRDVQRKSAEEPARPLRARWLAIAATCALVACGVLTWGLLHARAPRAQGPLALVRADATRSGLGPAQVLRGV